MRLRVFLLSLGCCSLLPAETYAVRIRRGDLLQKECDPVVFEGQNKDLNTRTMVVELNNKDGRQRALVLTHANDTSEPCALNWWLNHDPQGLVVCEEDSSGADSAITAQCPKGKACVPKTDDIWNGYARTMLATVVWTPQQASSSSSFLQGPQGNNGFALRKSFSAGRVAVLGLGSSTMALWMRKHLPQVQLSVAELVGEVAESAPCFGLDVKKDQGLDIQVSDGRAFLESSADGAFDAILVDAFDSDLGLPSCFKTTEFFEMTNKKLAPGGVLSFNAITYQKDTRRVLASLQAGFANSEVDTQFYVGNAPGADGIQEVVVAFKEPEANADSEEKKVWLDSGKLDMDKAQWWLEGAEFTKFDLTKAATSQKGEVSKPYADGELHCGAASTK